MHIAFITSEYPHEKVLHAAGIGTSIKNLVTALKKEDIRISIFVYSQKEDMILIENDIKIYLIKQKKYKIGTWFFYRKHIQNFINKIIIKEGINLIEAPDWTGITAFMNLKAPLVIRFHGSDAYFCNLEKRKQKLKNFWFEKLGINKAKAFIAPTDFAGNLSKKIFHIKKPITTIHYGLAIENFTNTNPENFKSGLILYIGTIIRKKGVLELPEIMKKVLAKNPKSHLMMIGGDSFDLQTQSQSTWELLQSLCDEAVKSRISYLGKVPYTEVKEFIKIANVCIFPTFAETLGMVTIESMAMQKAVVNSNIGWAKELIVDGESGFLVHPNDHNLFASRIIQILSDKNLAKEIGFYAQERVESIFNIQKIVKQNIEFYKSYI